MDKARYKKFIALQVCGLVLLLCGQWAFAMVLFVVGHIMSVRPVETRETVTVVEREQIEGAIQSEPQPPRDRDPADYWKDTPSPVATPPPVEEKESFGESPNKKYRKRKGDPYKGLKSVITTLVEDNTYPPNAFVIRGAKGKPLLCDYDDNGVPTDVGIELEPGEGWITSLCGPNGLDSSSVVLVHAVKGEEQNLVKALQVHKVQRKGRSVSVGEMARDGVLLDVAESLRGSFIEEV
jgi:hypothetical protein